MPILYQQSQVAYRPVSLKPGFWAPVLEPNHIMIVPAPEHYFRIKYVNLAGPKCINALESLTFMVLWHNVWAKQNVKILVFCPIFPILFVNVCFQFLKNIVSSLTV